MASRQNIFRMSDSDVGDYRAAVRGLKDISAQNLDDERGHFYFAGLHGLPVPSWCAHGTLLFLPWHRAYLYFLELALQEHSGASASPGGIGSVTTPTRRAWRRRLRRPPPTRIRSSVRMWSCTPTTCR